MFFIYSFCIVLVLLPGIEKLRKLNSTDIYSNTEEFYYLVLKQHDDWFKHSEVL